MANDNSRKFKQKQLVFFIPFLIIPNSRCVDFVYNMSISTVNELACAWSTLSDSLNVKYVFSITERNLRYTKWKMAVERSLGWVTAKKSVAMTGMLAVMCY